MQRIKAAGRPSMAPLLRSCNDIAAVVATRASSHLAFDIVLLLPLWVVVVVRSRSSHSHRAG